MPGQGTPERVTPDGVTSGGATSGGSTARLWMGAVLLAGLALAVLTHTMGFDMKAYIAANGFSILEVLAAHAEPEAFARDYPGGARLTTRFSPLVHVYLAGHDLLGLDGLTMLYGMIVLEICCVLAGLWMIWQTLLGPEQADGQPGGKAGGKTGQDVHRSASWDDAARFGFVVLVLVILLGSVQRANVVNFPFPFFHGQFYGFGDGLRLAAIALVLRRRWEWAALALMCAFAIHPIKALTAAAFVTGALAVDWRSALAPRPLAAMAVTVAGWVAWYMLTLRGDGGEGVPAEAFIAYTRALQSHWYPVDMGLLDFRHAFLLSPFLAVLALSHLALLQPGWPDRLRRQLMAGLAVLAVVTGAGLLISVWSEMPVLIRLSIARASTLISLLAPCIILAGAVLALRAGRRWMFAGFAAFLLMGAEYLWGVYDMALLFALVLAVLHWGLDPGEGWRPFTVAGPAALVALVLWITSPEVVNPVFALGPVCLTMVLFRAVLQAETWLGQRARAGRWRAPVPSALVALSLIFLTGSLYWSAGHGKAFRQAGSHLYLEAQLWAREATPPGTLFMVDPCRWYGWRDFSHRASIGTIREWYMTAWAYNDRAELLEQGRELGRTMGLEMEPHQVTPQTPQQMCRAARAVYYAPDLAGPRRVARRFDVDYLVFEKAFTKAFPKSVTERYVFENAGFVILPARELTP